MSITNILLFIIAIALSVIAIRVTFSFDVNKYLKSRDEKLREKIKNYCTHIDVNKLGNDFVFRSTFISPMGTTNWICQKCGAYRMHLDQQVEQERVKSMTQNIDDFLKQEKKFKKLVKKAGLA